MNIYLWQLDLRNVCEPLKIIVTSVTEVSRSKAKEDSHGATVATFVLEKVHAMFWTHLQQNENNCYSMF